MKKAVTFSVTLLFLFAVTSLFAIEADNFQYHGELKGPFQKNELYRLHLPREILKNTHGFCDDLRIGSPGSHEIPYSVIDYRYDEKRAFRTLRIIGYSEESDGDRVILKVPAAKRNLVKLQLEISEKGFLKRCIVEGSYNKKAWKFLAAENIYDFTPTVDLKKKSLRIGKSAFPYLRLILKPLKNFSRETEKNLLRLRNGRVEISRQDRKHLKITGVIGITERGKKKTRWDSSRGMLLQFPAPEKGVTSFHLITGVPAEKLVFKITNPYFYRRLVVEGITGTTLENYEEVTDQYLYRFALEGKKEEKLTLPLKGHHYKALRITIYDGDSIPLSIENVELHWPRRYIYFIPPENRRGLEIYWGSPNIKAPEYDIGHFINRNSWNEQKGRETRVDNIRVNKNYSVPEEEGMMRVLLIAFVLVMLSVMIYWLYRLVKGSELRRS